MKYHDEVLGPVKDNYTHQTEIQAIHNPYRPIQIKAEILQD